MNDTNSKFIAQILLQDPETHEELCPCGPPETIDGALVLIVENRGGDRKWKHTIKTEEV